MKPDDRDYFAKRAETAGYPEAVRAAGFYLDLYAASPSPVASRAASTSEPLWLTIGMSDDPDSPGSGEEEIWSDVDEAFPDGSAAVRRDGFTPKLRRVFLKTLRKTGCVQV